MSNEELKALCNALIALAQREDFLPTDSNSLADILQEMVSDEMYVSKADLIDFLED